MLTVNELTATQVAHFEKKIVELEAQRKHYVGRIGTSLTGDRTNYLYIYAFDKELHECRRSLAQLTNNES